MPVLTSAAELRAAARLGAWRGTTGGHCPAYQQANLVILAQESAVEFAAFCTRNPTPCPLTGGNQQKLLVAKMMLLEPEIVVIDEPTRGIDIGTKQQIYELITRLAAQGKAVIVISSEMQELIGVCHRILVMRGGRIVGEVTGERMTEQEIVVYATGATSEQAAMGTEMGAE